MVSQNLISLELDQAALDQIQECIQNLNSSLGFLIDLSIKQRQQLTKMGDGSQTFVNRTIEVARRHPDILPGRFDTDELERDNILYQQIRQIQGDLAPLVEKLDDTALAVGSDTYTAALEVYGYAKVAGEGDGLDDARSTMGKQFKRSNRTTTPGDVIPEPETV